MKKRDYKEVTEKQWVTTGYECDVCNKYKEVKDIPKMWVGLYAHHNDFPDDGEHYYICSPKCFFNLLKKFLIEYNKYKDTATLGDFNYCFVKEIIKYIK